MAPREVMLVRHAEKIGDPSREDLGGPNLSIRGFARAAALPTLFVPAAQALGCDARLDGGEIKAAYKAVELPGENPRFPTPDVIVASRDSDHSSRPRQTASPTAAAVGCRFVDDRYGHHLDEATRLGQDLLALDEFDGRVVLVVWHHGSIPNVAEALGIQPRPPWPGDDVFDRVWRIAFDNGVPSLGDVAQRLLFGDT